MRIIWLFSLLTVAFGDKVVEIYFIRHAQSIWNYFKRKEFMKDHGPARIFSAWNYKSITNDDGTSSSTSADGEEPVPLDVDDVDGPESVRTDEVSGGNTGKSYVFQVKGAHRLTDAPLSSLGHEQAIDLGVDVFGHPENVEYKYLAELIESEGITLCTSNLARTQQTLANFLNQRPVNKKTRVEIEILNCLQETSGFKDAWSSKAGRTDPEQAAPESLRIPQFHWVFGHTTTQIEDLNGPVSGIAHFLKGKMSGGVHESHRSAEARLADFTTYLNHHYDLNHKVFLVSGHSSWLRKLFRTRMGVGESNEVEKILHDEKLGNASIIKFTFELNKTDRTGGHIVPGSTVVIRDVVGTFSQEPQTEVLAN